jgi:hypothetical protein
MRVRVLGPAVLGPAMLRRAAAGKLLRRSAVDCIGASRIFVLARENRFVGFAPGRPEPPPVAPSRE